MRANDLDCLSTLVETVILELPLFYEDSVWKLCTASKARNAC
jgi:hypothetical protein